MTLNEIVKGAVLQALEDAKGNQRAAARVLGISRWKLARMLKTYGVKVVGGHVAQKVA